MCLRLDLANVVYGSALGIASELVLQMVLSWLSAQWHLTSRMLIGAPVVMLALEAVRALLAGMPGIASLRAGRHDLSRRDAVVHAASYAAVTWVVLTVVELTGRPPLAGHMVGLSLVAMLVGSVAAAGLALGLPQAHAGSSPDHRSSGPDLRIRRFY